MVWACSGKDSTGVISMALFAEIVRNVLVIVVLASFLELLLPDGEVKPFVRFAIGLFILIAVLNPVLQYLFAERNLKIELWDYRLNSQDASDLIDNGKEINQKLFEGNNAMIKEKLQGQISAVAMLVPGVDSVETLVELGEGGELENISILVRNEEPSHEEGGDKKADIKVFSDGGKALSGKDEKQIKEKILTVVKNLYGLEDVHIEIKFKEGE